ncbi:MAG TPA: COQ9 family protein [Croceibacterium sp.]|nr:COQ9 family protein [Croceibacterium sp.]
MAGDDRTLDELRLALAPDIASAAVFDGWSDQALCQAAALAGVDTAVARLAFPGGPMDMICAWIASTDAQMKAAFADGHLLDLKVRDRIRTLLLFRLDAVAGREEALRRALAIQAMPQNLRRSLKSGWNSADLMWRLAGDTATDYNHYTKRAILCGIYSATLAVFVDDRSEGKEETRAFIDRRIENVMQFEKTKAQLLRKGDGFDVARFLGRLRYPAR